MELLKNEKSKLHEACKRLVRALWESGYISEMDKQWLIYRIDIGDRTAYADVQELLLGITEEVGSIIY